MSTAPLSDVLTLNTGIVLAPGPPLLTFLAISNIAWELLSVYADLVVPAATGGYAAIVVNGNGIFQLQPSAGTRDSNEWTGSMVFPPNTAIIVTFNAAMAASQAGCISAQARVI